MRVNLLNRLALVALLAACLASCTGLGPTATFFKPTSPHDQYGQSLKEARLDKTAMGIDWLRAAERAIQDSVTINVPYRESGYFSASKPMAVGYRLRAQRGDRFLVKVETVGQQRAQVFIDVFALDEGSKPVLVAASKADTNVLNWEPRKNQAYLIRVQPELLRSGNFTIAITREPALSFPVQGSTSKQIASYFGAPREGGRRRHEGVDIFAPRGTPLLACADGTISGVGTNRLGGNVAYVVDNDRGIRIYYAHLDRWNVTNGQRVSRGDTVGFVGNTGNARTLSPHLHFGIYNNDGTATDPLPFIRLGRGPARQPLLSPARLGDSIRVAAARTSVRKAPATSGAVVEELPKQAAMTIMGGTDLWLRVETPGGRIGYVNAEATEPVGRPVRQLTLTSSRPLLDQANAMAAPITTLPAGTTVSLLASYGGFQLVRAAGQQPGWISAPVLGP